MANVTKKKNISKKTSNTINKRVKKSTKVNKVEENKVSRRLPFVDKILSRKRNMYITIFLILVFAVCIIDFMQHHYKIKKQRRESHK